MASQSNFSGSWDTAYKGGAKSSTPTNVVQKLPQAHNTARTDTVDPYSLVYKPGQASIKDVLPKAGKTVEDTEKRYFYQWPAQLYGDPDFGKNQNTNTNSNGYYSDGSWYNYGGGGGGGSTAAPEPVTWSEFDAGVQNKPSWWKAMKPSTTEDASAQYIANMNMLIPFLSPEDQKTAAQQIYLLDPTNFAHLNPEGIQVNPPTELTTPLQSQYTGSARAQDALNALSALAGTLGKGAADMGTGYNYLRSIMDASNQYGGAGEVNGQYSGQTRRQHQQMLGALDPLLSQSTQGDLAAYNAIAKMFANPFFSAGTLTPQQKAANGSYVYGQANAQLY